jgi:uncharacterized membrane protein YccC
MLATGLVCVVWIATAWPDGATAALMTAVMCSFFATLDDPAPAILSYLTAMMTGVLAAGIYLFAILPAVVDFAGLALVLAPPLIIVGALMPNPKTMAPAIASLALGSTTLALSDTYHADFGAYVNTVIAFLVAGIAATTITRLVRSVGAEWTAQRLRRATWKAIADAAAAPNAPYEPALLAGMLDRLCELVPRLAAADPHADNVVTQALSDVRVGLGVVALREVDPDLPAHVRPTVDATLDGLAARYRGNMDTQALRRTMDEAIDALSEGTNEATGKALINLVSIRHVLLST